MPRPRNRLSWIYDDSRQEFQTPSGRVITLWEIARLLDDYLHCKIDLQGPWTGWKLRGAALIPPRTGNTGPRLKPDSAKMLARWINEAEQPPHCPNNGSDGRPRLYLAYTRSH